MALLAKVMDQWPESVTFRRCSKLLECRRRFNGINDVAEIILERRLES